MKAIAFSILAIFFSSFLARAQRTSARAELSLTAGGEAVAVLSDSVQLTAIPGPDGFCQVRQSFLVKSSQTQAEGIMAGAGLYSEQRDSVGKLFVDLKAEAEQLPGRKNKDFKRFEFVGWVHRSRLVSSTLPEQEISEALAEKNKGVQEQRLNALYQSEGFVLKETPELNFRVQRLGGTQADEDAPMRIMVVNRAGGGVIAVVCNGGFMELPKVKETRSEHGWTIHYLQKPSPAIHSAVVEAGLSFMPL